MRASRRKGKSAAGAGECRIAPLGRSWQVVLVPPRFALGLSDYRALREGGFVYVDKTALIRDVLDDGAQVLLVPRPRRFGKTLNLSMLRCYFDRSAPAPWSLFEGLAIDEAGAEYRAHFQRYPVISLTFKDIKFDSYAKCLKAMKGVLGEAYNDHRYLLDGGHLAAHEVQMFHAVLQGRMDEVDCTRALWKLSELLHRHHGERVVILIDEYDTPIHEGMLQGYYDRTVRFFRNLLSSALKDNSHLFKSVITGILRVAKESLFSGLNNLKVCSLLATELATHFGFTEAEVEHLIGLLDSPDLLPEVRRWYNGYLFGGEVIYNPWSLLSLANSTDRELRPYWVSTSSNDLLRQLLIDWQLGLTVEMEALLSGRTIEQPIEEGIALREVSKRPEFIWSFLLFSGYLKVISVRKGEHGAKFGTLAIPNLEVRNALHDLFGGWLSAGVGGSHKVSSLLSALLTGDAEACEHYLDDLLLHVLSVHDVERPLPNPPGKKHAKRPPPEQIYQAFILGLLVNLAPRYEVRSNRESGHGRYDVMILPRTAGEPGVVLELKVLDKRRRATPEKALSAALRQVREKDYAAELRARGAGPIHEMGIVFEGKRAWVRAAAR